MTADPDLAAPDSVTKEQFDTMRVELDGFIDALNEFREARPGAPFLHSRANLERGATPNAEQVHTTLSAAEIQTQFGADHVHALARSLDEEGGVSAFAPWTLLRPIMVSSALVYWLLDSDIGITRRIARGMAFRHRDLLEQLDLVRYLERNGELTEELGGAIERIEGRISALKSTAALCGIDVGRGSGGRLTFDGETRPSDTLIAGLAFEEDVRFKILSASTHARLWALLPLSLDLDSHGVPQPQLTLDQGVFIVTHAFSYFSRAVWQLHRYLGFDQSELGSLLDDYANKLRVPNELRAWDGV